MAKRRRVVAPDTTPNGMSLSWTKSQRRADAVATQRLAACLSACVSTCGASGAWGDGGLRWPLARGAWAGWLPVGPPLVGGIQPYTSRPDALLTCAPIRGSLCFADMPLRRVSWPRWPANPPQRTQAPAKGEERATRTGRYSRPSTREPSAHTVCLTRASTALARLTRLTHPTLGTRSHSSSCIGRVC